MSQEQLESALDVMRRLPPSDVEENLGRLLDIVPALTEDLLSAIDQPLKIAVDPDKNKEFLLCDYNRDGDSYRSPWTNKYFPEYADGVVPSDRLRQLEILANESFEFYKNSYYETGVTSVYVWDIDDGFAACILIKKLGDQSVRAEIKGAWDSIHVIEVTPQSDKAQYKLTTTVMLSIITRNESRGLINLSGSITRQVIQEFPAKDDITHVINIGRMVEEMDNRLRSQLDQIYFDKTRDIFNRLRRSQGTSETIRRQELSSTIGKSIAGRGGSSSSSSSS